LVAEEVVVDDVCQCHGEWRRKPFGDGAKGEGFAGFEGLVVVVVVVAAVKGFLLLANHYLC